MKLTCFIVSTLLIVFITQQSTNGLPIDDVTTQHSCMDGFELLNGECQPIFSSSQQSDTEFNRSKSGEAALSYEGTTEESKKIDESKPCPEGKFRTRSGECKDIAFEDQSSTKSKSKKLDKKPEEHDNELLDHTTELVEHEHQPKDHKDEPTEHEMEPLDHTTELVEHERQPKDHKDEPTEHEMEPLDHTTELVEHERQPKDRKDESTEHENEPVEHERKPKHHKDESTEHENEPVEHKRKPKHHKDESAEHEKEPLDRTNEPVKHERKPKVHKGEPTENEDELLDHTSEPVEHENKSSGSNGEKFDTPKGCPPGTKVDEQGACQDEVEYTSTTLTMNLKDLLPNDRSCPVGMELFKNKCIYIKSKDNSTVDGLAETDAHIVNMDNTENKLVPVLKGGVCPSNTEYYSNGLCRERTRTSSPVKVLSIKEKCPVGEILIDGKCQQKDAEWSKTSNVARKTKPSTHDEEKPVESS